MKVRSSLFWTSNWNAGCGGYLDNFKILSILTLTFKCGFPCALRLEKLRKTPWFNYILIKLPGLMNWYWTYIELTWWPLSIYLTSSTIQNTSALYGCPHLTVPFTALKIEFNPVIIRYMAVSIQLSTVFFFLFKYYTF